MRVLQRLPQFQALAETRMTDSCIVTRADSTPVLNETTGLYEADDSAVYTGKCRVASPGTASIRELGDRPEMVNRTIVHLPVSASGFWTGDRVTITAAEDQQLVGATYRVRSVLDSSQATSRRLDCEDA